MSTNWSNIQSSIPSLNQLQTQPKENPIIGPDEPIRYLAAHFFACCVTLGIGVYVNAPKNGFSRSAQKLDNYGNIASLITLIAHFMYRHTKNMNQRIEAIQRYTNRLQTKEFTIVELLGITSGRYFFFKDKFEVPSRDRDFYQTCTGPNYNYKFVSFHVLTQRPIQPS